MQHALLTQKEHLLTQLEQGKLVLGIFTDLSKAFDHINHNLLLKKLAWYGIRKKAGLLVRSYLEHRSQIVTVDDSSSDPLPVLAGVPQGSILEPFLFNMFVNDIDSIGPQAKFIIFLTASVADDLIDDGNSILLKLEECTQKMFENKQCVD